MKTECCVYSLAAPRWCVSDEYAQHMFFFLWMNKKKYYVDIPSYLELSIGALQFHVIFSHMAKTQTSYNPRKLILSLSSYMNIESRHQSHKNSCLQHHVNS